MMCNERENPGSILTRRVPKRPGVSPAPEKKQADPFISNSGAGGGRPSPPFPSVPFPPLTIKRSIP